MSRIAVSICVGDPEEPLVLVAHEMTVIVDSEDSEELVLTAAAALGDMVERVRSEATKQLGTLAQVAADE